MATRDVYDARKRPFTQLRLYGELAQMIDERAERENKSRSILVDQLLRAAWAVDTTAPHIEPIAIEPARTFDRQQGGRAAPTAVDERPRPRAHVFGARRL